MRVAVLGTPTWLGGSSSPRPLDRKTAAVLAFLALTGGGTRSRVAGLLWPDSRESTARNNLVQLLRKLRLTVGEDLVVGADVVRLSQNARVDALDLRELFLLGHHAAFLEGGGEVLGGYVYGDCPEFDDWLRGERARWRGWRREALAALSAREEERGAYEEALGWAEGLLVEDATSEEAFVRLLRLQYLVGDREGALHTFARCEDMLRREHRAAPLPTTLDLVNTIRLGSTLPPAAPRPQRVIPPAVLCPPVLAGREREWAVMEEAWARGQGIILSGDPGVGKTRLMREFAASKGRWFHLDGRPGDTSVPYGTYARVWRGLLRGRPDLELPDWVREPFSLLLPELWPTRPPPLTSPADKERLFAATGELAFRISQGMTCVIADDTQYYDAASMELGASIAARFVPFDPNGGVVPMLTAHRRGQLPPAVEGHLRGMVAAGLGVWIDVEPLDEEAATRLLVSLKLPEVQRHAPRLARSSGGNPLFLLEAVKHLLEDQARPAGEEVPPVPEKVHALITERLRRLSPRALLLAQAASVLQSEFDLDLVAAVLDAPLLDVLPAWQELERTQVLAGGRFSHDLVYESVRAAMSVSVRQALHRSAARVLERQGGNPARIARHWLEGGDPGRAVPGLRAAAGAACAALRFVEAAEALEQAATILEANGELDAAFGVWASLIRDVLRPGVLDERHETALRRLADVARTPEQQALVERCLEERRSADTRAQAVS